MPPKISIVTPSFNRAGLLRDDFVRSSTSVMNRWNISWPTVAAPMSRTSLSGAVYVSWRAMAHNL